VADAVLTQCLIVAVAALAGLFLVVLVLAAAFWLLAWALARPWRTGTRHAEFIAETLPAPAPARAVRDTEPGIRLDWQDDCELIYSMPAYQPAAAIPDEQQKGDL
jgi:hypothetical protein